MRRIKPALSRTTFLLALLTLSFSCLTLPSLWAGVSERVLTSFGGKNGANPQAGLVGDAAGNLYGTTSAGGSLICTALAGCGTVFELGRNASGAWTRKTLHFFNGTDGAYPLAALVIDTAGNLFGTTAWGGPGNCTSYAFQGCGVVFELSPGTNGSWTFKTIHTFSRLDGSNPSSSLIFDTSGNLYGTTYTDGSFGYGTIFELSPGVNGSWTLQTLHNFNNTDGYGPTGWLTWDTSGNLYGVTNQGGTDNTGTVFQLTKQSDGNWTETVLHSFGHSGGTLPSAGVVFDSGGNLYGTTVASGGTCGCQYGTVFKLTPGTNGTWAWKILHTFTGTDGDSPLGLILVGKNLYGLTFVGGTSNDGVVFELSPSSNGTWVELTLHTFSGADGAGPVGALSLMGGDLYGASGYGGATNNDGTVFTLASSPATR